MTPTTREQIQPGDKVTLRLSLAERDLVLEHAFLDPDAERALGTAAVEGSKIAARLTLDDLEEMLGAIASAANHAESLGPDFRGLLPWSLIDNRPYLRCLHGWGLCLWRRGDLAMAAQVFRRMLWLNPHDNQGARFLLREVEAGRPWEAAEDER